MSRTLSLESIVHNACSVLTAPYGRWSQQAGFAAESQQSLRSDKLTHADVLAYEYAANMRTYQVEPGLADSPQRRFWLPEAKAAASAPVSLVEAKPWDRQTMQTASAFVHQFSLDCGGQASG